MDVIGQHLDELDAHWLTFGNDYLEQWEILSDDTQIREAFQIFFRFECNILTLLGLGDPFSTNSTRNSEEFDEKDR